LGRLVIGLRAASSNALFLPVASRCSQLACTSSARGHGFCLCCALSRCCTSGVVPCACHDTLRSACGRGAAALAALPATHVWCVLFLDALRLGACTGPSTGVVALHPTDRCCQDGPH
jgi:hypothetical protein